MVDVVSLAAKRATENNSLWTVADMLREALAEAEGGGMPSKAVLITLDDKGGYHFHRRAVDMRNSEIIALLEAQKHVLLREMVA